MSVHNDRFITLDEAFQHRRTTHCLADNHRRLLAAIEFESRSFAARKRDAKRWLSRKANC